MDDFLDNDLFDDDDLATEPQVDFGEVLNQLMDAQHPFPPALWNQFSDIKPEQLRKLGEFWGEVSSERKITLLQDLAGMMEYNFQVSFDDFAKFCLNDDEPGVREGAIRLLFEYERRDLIKVMLDILENDADEFVQAAAAAMLGNYIYLGELEELPRKEKGQIEDKLLYVIQESDSVIVQRRCLEALSYSSLEEVKPLILAAYETGEKDWIITALFSMGRSADHAWAGHIVRNLDHDDPDIQFEAIQAAGEMYLEKALPDLLALVEDADALDQPIRMALAEAFKNIGGEEVISALNTLLEYAEDDEEIEIIDGALEFAAFTNSVDVPDMFGFSGAKIDDVLEQFTGHSHSHDHDHNHDHGEDE